MAKEPKTKAAEKDEEEAPAPPKRTSAKLRPAVDFPIVNPETKKPLASEGETVKLSRYWEKQLRRGHVVEVD